MPISWTCRRCLLRGYQPRSYSTGSNASTRPVPLRIFATEDSGNDGPPGFVNVGHSTNAEKQKRYEEWLNKRLELSSSTERLSDEFRARVGRTPPTGLHEAARLRGSQRANILPRMRARPDTDVAPLTHVTPADLLQNDEIVETRETITAAIEGCISAAIDRLELKTSPNDIKSRSIDRIKIPHDQYTWLSAILDFQFTKSQIVDYGVKCGLKTTQLQRANMSDAIGMILQNVWNLEKEPERLPDEALITKSFVSFE